MFAAALPAAFVWPGGHKFAFSIFDDTDWATVENVKPVYDLLADLGMRTTKSVWMFRGEGSPKISGATCEDRQGAFAPTSRIRMQLQERLREVEIEFEALDRIPQGPTANSGRSSAS